MSMTLRRRAGTMPAKDEEQWDANEQVGAEIRQSTRPSGNVEQADVDKGGECDKEYQAV